jgi:apoptosis-inducing factor 2
MRSCEIGRNLHSGNSEENPVHFPCVLQVPGSYHCELSFHVSASLSVLSGDPCCGASAKGPLCGKLMVPFFTTVCYTVNRGRLELQILVKTSEPQSLRVPTLFTMLDALRRASLFARLVSYGLLAYLSLLQRSFRAKLLARHAPPPRPCADRTKNIVIVGAAFAGYHVAKVLSTFLSRDSEYRVVVIEPNSHFNFTWVLPRFCVIEGHEHKAFIPYGGYLIGGCAEAVRWIRDRVTEIRRGSVRLRDSKEEIPYDYLVLATGSEGPRGLPSRVGAEEKSEGVDFLKGFQQRIKNASKIVVAGGGAAGVELATDAKSLYPEKTVVLVHSRPAVMNRFGRGLQTAALKALEGLGVEVVLGARGVHHPDRGAVVLPSGREIGCDLFVGALNLWEHSEFDVANYDLGQVDCTGQQPASGVISGLSPTSISSSGNVKVRRTLQIADDSLPNVYVCGDVADLDIPNPNARSATRQAEVVARNILGAVRGKEPQKAFSPQWGDGVIKLTLSLVGCVSFVFISSRE